MNRRGFMKAFAALGFAAPTVTAVAQEPVTEILTGKFTGDGWYTRKEPAGTVSVHKIERVWSGMDREWIYVTKDWPAQHSYADNVFNRNEVNGFIFQRAEWVPDTSDLVWADTWRVRRHS